MNIAWNGRLQRSIQESFTCRKSTTWDRRIYLPSEGRRAEDFFALKNLTASDGFEPANLGTKGQNATSRPPKPLTPFPYLHTLKSCTWSTWSLALISSYLNHFLSVPITSNEHVSLYTLRPTQFSQFLSTMALFPSTASEIHKWYFFGYQKGLFHKFYILDSFRFLFSPKACQKAGQLLSWQSYSRPPLPPLFQTHTRTHGWKYVYMDRTTV